MISDQYRNFVNGMRARNGMAPVFPSSAEASDPDIVDATDETGDGGLQDALSLLRDGARIANGEKAAAAAGVKDEFSQLGANAVAARRLARLVAQAPDTAAADEARAKAAKYMASFILAAHKAAGWMK